MADSKFGGYNFQKLDHNAIAANEYYRLLAAAERCIYWELRIQAGTTRQRFGTNDGFIGLGNSRRAKRAEVVRWLATSVPGLAPRTVESALNRLREFGLISIHRGSGAISLVGWRDEQDAAPTENASRKRRSRAKQALEIFDEILSDRRGDYISRTEVLERLKARISGGKKFAADFLERSVAQGLLRSVDGDSFFVELIGTSKIASISRDSVPAGGDSVPLPPPSISTFEAVTNHRMEPVTSHNNQIEKRDINISSISRSSRGGGRGTESFCSVTKEDIWTGSPLDVCERLVEKHKRYDTNTFAMYLRKLRLKYGESHGTKLFRSQMETLLDQITHPGPHPIRIRAAYLNAMLQKALDGGKYEQKI